MPEPATARPAICLNMIVRNEAHVVSETLDSVAPFITSWVIVDTGSDDGTQDLIRNHMARLGISGELHERPWRDFGHNRSEALDFARGHGDYIWVMDADDLVVGTPDFSHLSADAYVLRYGPPSFRYWRRLLLRDGLHWYFEGPVHERAWCTADPWQQERLDAGDYYIDSRRLGARNLDPQKYARDRDLLLAHLQRQPDHARSVFYLARSYYDLGDYHNAREWFLRRAEMGGWGEEVFYSLYQAAEAMSKLGAPWPDVQDAYLRAWESRPTRAEPLFAIALRYRLDKRHRLGHLYAQRAAAIPVPQRDELFVHADIHTWRAADEQAVCAYWIGEHREVIALCQRLLAGNDVPDHERERITSNRDYSVSALIDAAASYPEELVQSLVAGPRDAEVTLSLVAGPDRGATEQMLNSFLHCCLDVSRVGRFLVVDAGLSAQDRATLLERYGFLEFAGPGDASGAQPTRIRWEVGGRFWLHLGEGWRFFAPERFIGRLTAVFAAEPEVFQVGVNFGDAGGLAGAGVVRDDAVRWAADGSRYVLADVAASGPAMFDTARLDRATAAGLRTASLDEVFCVAGR